MDHDLEIPVNNSGQVDFYRLESSLERCFSNDPSNTAVNLLGTEKTVANEIRGHLQSSFDYKILNVGKSGRNYLIKVGADI